MPRAAPVTTATADLFSNARSFYSVAMGQAR
jgi:hypothetical protein